MISSTIILDLIVKRENWMTIRMLFVLNAKKDINSFRISVFAIINFTNRIIHAINVKTDNNVVFIPI